MRQGQLSRTVRRRSIFRRGEASSFRLDTCTSGTLRRGDRVIRPYDYIRCGETSKKVALTFRHLNVVVRSPPSYERWAEIARLLPRGFRPSGRVQSFGYLVAELFASASAARESALLESTKARVVPFVAFFKYLINYSLRAVFLK